MMLKSDKYSVNLGSGLNVLFLVLKFMKVLENYYTTAISSQLLLE